MFYAAQPHGTVKVGAFGATTTVPPAKSAALSGAQDLEGNLANPVTVTRMAAFPDTGTATDISAVKTALVNDMTADNAVFRAPLSQDAIATRLGDPLAQIWTTAAQAVQYQQHYDALKLLLAQGTSFVPFEDNRFVVNNWMGVSVSGTTAFCLAEGHDEVQRSGVWKAADVEQYQIKMTFESGTWKLGEVKSVRYQP
jgi:hypothetical protein